MLRRLIAPSLILLTVTLAAWYTVDSLRPEAAPDIAGLAVDATPTSPLTSTPTSPPAGITEPVIAKGPDHEPNARPSEWFWQQRAYPHGDIKQSSYALMLEQAAAKEREAQLARTGGDKSLILSAQWEQRGPSNIGARVTDLAIHPGDPDIVYAAMASGGIFKTVDGGSNWTAIFDDQPVLTIGAVTLDPQNPETIYVGTGEANAISYSFFGLGVFKSSDGGVSWQHLGLEATRYIARIVVDPSDSDRVYLLPGRHRQALRHRAQPRHLPLPGRRPELGAKPGADRLHRGDGPGHQSRESPDPLCGHVGTGARTYLPAQRRAIEQHLA